MNHSKLIKFEIFSLIFVFICGSLFHFTYQLSGNNLFVGLFSSVNESYYYSYKKIVTKKYRSNCTLFSILSIVILFGSFILFTLVPPKIGIFNDPITNTYGIFKIK